jgi:MATE family multidrug resistance protein
MTIEDHYSVDQTDMTFEKESSDKEEVIKEEDKELFGLSDESTPNELLAVLVKQASPAALSFFLNMGGNIVNMAFAGHYVLSNGEKSAVFAGISLATLFGNVSCRSIFIGMTSAVETLASQHNGAGNYKEVGIVLQRSFLILGCFILPIVFSWFYAERAFKFIGVEPAVCEVIQRYLYIRMFAIPMDAFMYSYEKYLFAIGVFKPTTWANVVLTLSVLIMDIVFVSGMDLHYDCLSWSWTISLWISGILQVVLSLSYPEVQRTLIKPYFQIHPSAWTEWKEFIVLGLPGTIMLCGEWWAFEILQIFASFLGTVEVAALAMAIQTSAFAYMIALGIGIATTSLIGNALGADRMSLAKRILNLSLKCIVSLELLLGVLIATCGQYFIQIFTTDEEVLSVARSAMYCLAGLTMIDGVQCIAGSAMKGAGKQFIGAIGNLVAFYAIGLPLAWMFCFKMKLSVAGLLLGMCGGVSIQLVISFILIYFYQNYLFTRMVDTKKEGGFELIRKVDDDEDEFEDEDLEEGKGGIVVMNPMKEIKVISPQQ